jgi:hypothetical protein
LSSELDPQKNGWAAIAKLSFWSRGGLVLLAEDRIGIRKLPCPAHEREAVDTAAPDPSETKRPHRVIPSLSHAAARGPGHPLKKRNRRKGRYAVNTDAVNVDVSYAFSPRFA